MKTIEIKVEKSQDKDKWDILNEAGKLLRRELKMAGLKDPFSAGLKLKKLVLEDGYYKATDITTQDRTRTGREVR